jgi:hypothetical protein
MGQDDRAILVGVSQYANPAYPALKGPLNDVTLMETWLKNQNIPVTKITTIEPLLFGSPDKAPPLPDDFQDVFLKLERERMSLRAARVTGRLYLYFSGHGFCARDIDRDAQAALYTANASSELFAHIYGTYFARRAKAKALFKEIVLIMDCCRDSEVNRVPIPPMMGNTPDDTLAQNVSLLMIYAVPKGGKAQERPVPDRNDVCHGLLTHAFMSAIEHGRPDGDGIISATRLRDHLLESWDAVCGADPPPRPEVFLPSSQEMYFAAQNVGVLVIFDFSSPALPETMIALRDASLQRIGEFSITDPADDLVETDGAVLSWTRELSQIKLRVTPGLYEYEIKRNGLMIGRVQFKAEQGEIHVPIH